ncbi:MAG: GDP-L-fucose synthase family protein [Bacillota bacterium]
MERLARIYIAGHNGLVGSAIKKKLEEKNYPNLLFCSKDEVDLRDASAIQKFFQVAKPEYVFLAAAKVGGIKANYSYPADFIYDNLMIQTNVIHASYKYGVKKLLFLGSSCIYPKFCPQPIKEEYLLTGSLEETNEAYAIAKIAGIKMCQAYHKQYSANFISAMPSNLYGPNDHFDLENSHVLPALIRRFHEAKIKGEPYLELWGTGEPRREFLYVDDLAEACLFLMHNYDSEEIINVGTGEDVSIKELAEIIKATVDFKGEILWNSAMPDGTPRKAMNVSKINNLGWKAKIPLQKGIELTYQWFLSSNKPNLQNLK